MIIKRKLGPKGQLLLPKDVRELLGVKPGEEVFIEIDKNEVKIRPVMKSDQFLAKFYDVPKKLKEKINFEKILDEEYVQ